MAETQIKDLPSAGTILETMYVPVQQLANDDIAQQVQLSELLKQDEIVGQQSTDDVLSVTPKAFTDTNSTTTRYGTNRQPTDSEIENKAAVGGNATAIPVEKIDNVIQSGIPLSEAIAVGDFDPLTEGTLTNRDLRKLTYGTRGKIEGVFTFAPSVTTKTAKIYINNIIQPNDYINTGTGTITNLTDSPTELHSLGVKIESSGTSVSGGGQIIITLGQGSTAWNTSKLYAIGLNIDYSANI